MYRISFIGEYKKKVNANFFPICMRVCHKSGQKFNARDGLEQLIHCKSVILLNSFFQ